MVDRHEPTDLAPKIPAIAARHGPSPFNAALALSDSRGAVVPYLAESLPQLNSGTWRVSPDDRMETTFRLRPNLTWHDGHALTAEDFVFAHRVYTHPSLGVSSTVPQNKVEEIAAPDARTLVVRFKQFTPPMLEKRRGSIMTVASGGYNAVPIARKCPTRQPRRRWSR